MMFSSLAGFSIHNCNARNALVILPGTAIFFRVMRHGTKLAGATEQGHESEKHVIGYHYTVENNSAPGDAGERVRHLFHGAITRQDPATLELFGV